MTEHRLEALSGRRRAGLQLETWDLRLVRAIAIAMSEVSASCSVEPREGGRERVAPSVPEAAASLAPSPARLASGLPEGHASMSAVTRELVLPNWPEASAARHMRARGGAIAPHGHASRRDGWHPPGGHDRRHPGEGVRTALLSSRSGAVAREPIPPEAGVGASRVNKTRPTFYGRLVSCLSVTTATLGLGEEVPGMRQGEVRGVAARLATTQKRPYVVVV